MSFIVTVPVVFGAGLLFLGAGGFEKLFIEDDSVIPFLMVFVVVVVHAVVCTYMTYNNRFNMINKNNKSKYYFYLILLKLNKKLLLKSCIWVMTPYSLNNDIQRV